MINQVTVGHCLEVLKRIPDKSVHCCVTSPPYYGLRDYGLPPVLWPEISFSPMPGLPPLYVPEQECCLGLEKDIWSYVGHLVAVFREVWRVMRDDGTLWLNLGDSYATPHNGKTQMNSRFNERWGNGDGTAKQKQEVMAQVGTPKKVPENLKSKDLMGIPWRVAYALQADGWYLRSDVIWHKPNPMPESVTDRPTKAHEYVFLMSKGEKYFYDGEAIRESFADERMGNPGNYRNGYSEGAGRNDKNTKGKAWLKGQEGNVTGRNRRTVWTVATQSYEGAHFATFPTKLIEPMILASTSEYGVCGECGAQWVREVELGEVTSTGGSKKGARASNLGTVSIKGQTPENAFNTGEFKAHKHITTGWRPSCSCNAPIAPAIVLDPFMGSGTTGKVALTNRRNFIGIDANPVYAEELATERLNGTQIKLV